MPNYLFLRTIIISNSPQLDTRWNHMLDYWVVFYWVSMLCGTVGWLDLKENLWKLLCWVANMLNMASGSILIKLHQRLSLNTTYPIVFSNLFVATFPRGSFFKLLPQKLCSATLFVKKRIKEAWWETSSDPFSPQIELPLSAHLTISIIPRKKKGKTTFFQLDKIQETVLVVIWDILGWCFLRVQLPKMRLYQKNFPRWDGTKKILRWSRKQSQIFSVNARGEHFLGTNLRHPCPTGASHCSALMTNWGIKHLKHSTRLRKFKKQWKLR